MVIHPPLSVDDARDPVGRHHTARIITHNLARVEENREKLRGALGGRRRRYVVFLAVTP